MKLYMRQKVFSWRDRFYIQNEYQDDCYYVEGELFSWGKKLHVYDNAGREVAFIRQKLLCFLPKYDVLIDDQEIAQIVKEFTFFRPRYHIDGLNWQIDGDFWDHDYEVLDNGRRVVGIHKKWLTWGDCYEIDIEENENVIYALAVVLAIDCAIEAASSN